MDLLKSGGLRLSWRMDKINLLVACEWNEVSLGGPNGGYFTELFTDEGIKKQFELNLEDIWDYKRETIEVGDMKVEVERKIPKKSVKLIPYKEEMLSFRKKYKEILIEQKLAQQKKQDT